MGPRTINFILSSETCIDSVMPSTIQDAGIQGEHRATKVVFNIESGSALIKQLAPNGSLINGLSFRIEVEDSAGSVTQWEPIVDIGSDGGTLSLLIEDAITSAGGVVIVRLVIEVLDADCLTAVKYYSYPAKLRFVSSAAGTSSFENYKRKLSESGYLEAAKKAQADAAEASEKATFESTNAQAAASSAIGAVSEVRNYSEISQAAASTAVVADVSAREYSEAASQSCAEANEHAQTASAAGDTALTAATKAEEAVIKLAVPFTESGAQVICHPLEDSELSVVADISAVRAASGTPSPDNIIALNGFDSVRLHIGAQNDADSKDITVELGQTVYGGNIDFKTGILTVNSKMYTCTESTPWYAADTTSSYNKLDSRKRYSLALSDIDVVKDAYKTDKRIMCSHFPTTWASNTWNNTDGISAGANEKLIYVYCDAYSTDATAFKTMMAGAQIIYPLAQPYTVELTAQQVIALAGANTISANCGNVTVSGVQEPAWTLQTLLERVAALENAVTQ